MIKPDPEEAESEPSSAGCTNNYTSSLESQCLVHSSKRRAFLNTPSVAQQAITDTSDKEIDLREIVKFGDVDLAYQSSSSSSVNRSIYCDTVVPRNRLQVAHHRFLLPAHTIPRTPTGSGNLPSGPTQSDTGFCGSDTLRPTVSFLMRIGLELVSSQYALFVNVNTTENKSRKRKSTDNDDNNQTSHQSNPINNVEHLLWKRKLPNPKWSDIQFVCANYQCPYVPTSVLALLRHLEIGHQKFTHIDSLKPAAVMTLTDLAKNENAHLPSFALGTFVANNLMSGFYVPLLITPKSYGFYKENCCPLCAYHTTTWINLLTHVARQHPLLSVQPVKKPKLDVCSICGLTVPNSGNFRLQKPGQFIIHDMCSPNRQAYQTAAWSACDVHPLACLMLYPTQYACFALPFSVADFLYKLTEHMIAMRVSQYGVWNLASYTLRCCAAISAVFGRLADVNLVSPLCLYPRLEEYIKKSVINNNSLKNHITPNPKIALLSSDNGDAIVQSKLILPITKAIHSDSSLNNAILVNAPVISSSSNSNKTQLPVNIQSDTIHSPLVSVTTSMPTFIFVSKPLPIKSQHLTQATSNMQISTVVTNINGTLYSPDQNLSENTRYMRRQQNKTTSLIDLTTDVQQSRPQTSSTPVPIAPLAQWTNSHTPNRHRLARILPITKVPCELCSVGVTSLHTSQRNHILNDHNIASVPSLPDVPCSCCGQLFWTATGGHRHQCVPCIICRYDRVCQSTVLVHIAIHHRKQLMSMLQNKPYRCIVCAVLFKELTSLLSHLQTAHSFAAFSDLDFESSVTGGTKFPYLLTLYTALPSSNRAPPPLPYRLPDNIAVSAQSQSVIYVCSVCNCCFVSTSHLDLHMAQSGHQYFCPWCPFTSARAISLWKHCATAHNTEDNSFKLSKVLRPIAPKPRVTKFYTTKTTPSTATKPTVTRNVQTGTNSNATEMVESVSTFHACSLCPVYCRTLKDLNEHHAMVHHSGSNMCTTQIASSCSIYTAPLTAKLSNLPVSSSVPLPVSYTLSQSSKSMHDEVPPMVDDDDVVCPICNFHSKHRSVVMQHIADTH